MMRRKRGPAKRPEDFLGDPLPPSEAALWIAMDEARRAKALQRMAAARRWELEEGLDAKVVAADAGMQVTRFYEMAKAWRERPSLSSLGTFAAAAKTRTPAFDGAVRKVLVGVVDADPEASVRSLALALQAAVDIPEGRVPSHNTFRRYVEDELRRRRRRLQAGDDVQFDCCACTLTPTDDALLTVFAVIDVATHVVLGAALGDAADSVAGYAGAARDALRRIDLGLFAALAWVERMARAELVAGLDVDRWVDARARFAEAEVGAPLEPSTRSGRFGRYLRPLTGLRIGSVVLLPQHTGTAAAPAGLVRSAQPTPDQRARLAVEVDEYSAAKAADAGGDGDGHPPVELRRMLTRLAGV